MIKNTIIRIDENNLIMLEIDPEEHSGQGGILDTVSGNFYPFSSVVSPTHSSIVRFDDTNVVLIKLDPDTHDSSAIIMDEVSGNVYPICGEPSPSIPDEYQEVEYIATTNNAYINTGITLTNDSARIKARIYPTTNSHNSNPWAIRNGTSAGDVAWSAVLYGNGAKFSMTTGNGGNGFVVDSTFSSLINNIIDIDTSLSAGNSANANMSLTITMNNTSETITGSGLSYNNSMVPVCVFGNNQYSQAYAQFKGRVYSFKMWNDNVLVADLIPVYRVSDNVIGMYDVVSETFKTNAGSGSFTKGPDIEV